MYGRPQKAARTARRTGAIGGPRQPRSFKRKAADLCLPPGVELKDLLQDEENDGSGYIQPPLNWMPLPPAEDPEAARPYYIRVQNVVSTCTVNKRINPCLAAEACHGRFDDHIFPAATIPMKWPLATVCAFNSGKLVVAGARDQIQGLAAALLFLNKLRAYTNEDYELFNFHVENVVGSASVGRRMDLARIRREHSIDTEYTSETFAGLSYRPKPRAELPLFRNRRPVVILFESGRIVICGCYTRDHLVAVFHYIYDFVQPYLRGL